MSINYPNMSYCMVENTNRALDQIIDELNEHDSISEFVLSLSNDEKRAWRSLTSKMNDLVEMMIDEDLDQ